jgi:hypothetical protein
LVFDTGRAFLIAGKHIKVAPHRWYYHTDRLGLFIWQDMPETIHGSGGGATFMQVRSPFEVPS